MFFDWTRTKNNAYEPITDLLCFFLALPANLLNKWGGSILGVGGYFQTWSIRSLTLPPSPHPTHTLMTMLEKEVCDWIILYGLFFMRETVTKPLR